MIRMLWDSFLHVSNREAEKCDINEVEDKNEHRRIDRIGLLPLRGTV